MNGQPDEWFGYVPDGGDGGEALEIDGAEIDTEQAAALVADRTAADRDAVAWVAHLKGGELLKRATVVTYRCGERGRGCELARVVSAPGGVLILVQPVVKLSRERNRGTSAEVRADRTIDGDRRWRMPTGALPQLGSTPLSLRCDHRELSRMAGEMREDAATRRGQTVVL